MNTTIPTIGRMVIYHTTEAERNELQEKQKQLPAIIVATYGDHPDTTVNLQIMLDGPGSFWKGSVAVTKPDADGNYREGSYSWPVRQ